MTRRALWPLLAVVAAAAAVLSFASLRDLAVLCGYPTRLVPLFPIGADAGAVAACLTWLGGRSAATPVGRRLTWLLLCASVALNAVVHALTASGLGPTWWLVVRRARRARAGDPLAGSRPEPTRRRRIRPWADRWDRSARRRGSTSRPPAACWFARAPVTAGT